MMKRLLLHDFEEPHINENITVTLMNGTPMYSNRAALHVETQPFAVYLRDYPDIIITSDMLATRESACTIRAGGLFLTVQDSAFKKIASIWRENGFIEAVRATAMEDPSQVTKTLHWISSRLKWVFELLEQGTFRNELLPVSGSGSVADFTATRDWDTALVRCLSWHPHCTRLAVATRDDRIRIFSQDIQGVAVLRHSAQKSVYCMSWRPNAGRELAAACQSGVLIWTVELGVTSNSLSHAILLRQRNHAPVTSVTWHPQGDLLVSCSPSDSNMIVWDVAKETCVPLKRVGGGGLCFTRWSPCGWRLLAATSRTVFRIWNTNEGSAWSVDRWTIPNGRVAAACFGPNLALLFTSTEDPATVFSLPLLENIFDVKGTVASGDIKVAIPLIDMTRVSFPTENGDDEVIVGGRVVAMDWDPSGKYLAVLFQDSPLIALFKTKVRVDSTAVEIRPGCLINGFPGEVPNCMHFYQNYDKILEKICLTIAWSSGRVQQFPIVDGPSPHHSKTPNLMSNSYSRANISDLSNTSFSNYSLLR